MSLSNASTYIILALAALFVGIILVNWTLSLRQLERGAEFRKAAGRRLGRLRLHRMLRILGIDPSRYLDRTPVGTIETHMENCESCPNTAKCDQRLGLDAGPTDAYGSFCPNYDSLKTLDR